MRGATGRKPAGRAPAGLAIPGGPRGRTGWPGAAALGLAPGRLVPRGPPTEFAFKNSSVQTVAWLTLPSRIDCLAEAALGPYYHRITLLRKD